MKTFCLSILFASLLSVPISAQQRLACDYGVTTCEAYANADAIFIGEIIKIAPATRNMWQTDDDFDQTAYVTIHKIFKGRPRSSIVLRQLGSRHTQKFIPGEHYVLYANYVPTLKIWEVRSCGLTRMAKYAQSDLRYLNGLPANAKRTRISGEVMRYEPTGHAEDSPERLAGITLRIVGNGREYEATTDAKGIYEIYDALPGTYTIYLKVPNGLVFLWAIHSGHDPVSRAKSLEMELSPGGCSSMDILLTPDKTLKKKDEEKIGKLAPPHFRVKKSTLRVRVGN